MRLLYESPDKGALANPDNLTVATGGHLLLCENAPGGPQRIRGLTPEGRIYDFARANGRRTEFAGVCFDAASRTLFANQQGRPGEPGVTYAIWGPWAGI
ncbi:MAG: alkaline phosphatase PhoX [Actinomycetota bacterium]